MLSSMSLLYGGVQNWTQHSRSTSPGTGFLDLLAMCFLMHPLARFLDCGHLVFHQDPQVLHCRAALQQVSPQPVLVRGLNLKGGREEGDLNNKDKHPIF